MNGDGIITTVAGSLSAGDGTGTKAYLGNPDGIAAAADGSIYVADPSSHRIRKVAPDGTIGTVAVLLRLLYSCLAWCFRM